MNNAKRRIVITGIGIVSALGADTESTWQGLLAEKSGIKKIQNFDASSFPTQIAAEVDAAAIEPWLPKSKLRKYTINFTRFAWAAAEQALQDAAIKPTAKTASRWGCVVGSGMMTAEHASWEKFSKEFAASGEVDFTKLGRANSEFFSATEFAKTITNSGLAILTQYYGVNGYCNEVHTACASGGQAMGMALQAMRRGDADIMLAGGFDSMVNPIGLSSFCLLGAMSTLNDNPQAASRPFDANRDGFVLGEGAAFLILETFEHAKQRGAKIYAELAGEGNSLSSYRITDTDPQGDGPIQAIQGALNDAGLNTNDIDYINAHGTSTKMNDLSETNAIKHVFVERAYKIPVSSTKSLTGHLIAGAGAIEAAFSALAIHNSMVPKTCNYTTADPECDLDYVTDAPRSAELRAVLSNSIGFGGSNSCLAFRKVAEA